MKYRRCDNCGALGPDRRVPATVRLSVLATDNASPVELELHFCDRQCVDVWFHQQIREPWGERLPEGWVLDASLLLRQVADDPAPFVAPS